MDVTLQRNGYNVERRKMYLENPRHNLRSSVELLWQQSLQGNSSNDFERKKQQSNQLTKQSYNRSVEKKIQEELKINKSTFRVMPSPESRHTIEHARTNLYDSLNRQVQNRKGKQSMFEKPIQSLQNRSNAQSLSKSVFGYDLDRQMFRKESYLSRVLGDRLSPYLKKDDTLLPRHQSFTINQPVSLKY